MGQKTPEPNAFHEIPHTPRGHFVLHLYAAIYCLINHVRQLGEITGEELEHIFERYPFLARYFTEMLPYLPDQITWEQALGWWEQEILAWEQASREHLPLAALTEGCEVDFYGRIALLIVGLVEEDSRFGTLFARLQEPLAYRRPCLELVGQTLIDGEVAGSLDPWHLCRPLIDKGLLEVINEDAPRSEWVLRIPSLLWNVVRGEIDAQPVAWCQFSPAQAFPPVSELIFPPPFLQRLEQIPALVQDGKAQAIVLRGTPGSDRLQVMGALARAMGCAVVRVNDAAQPSGQVSRSLGPFCAMTRSLPVFICDLGPGETMEVPPVTGYAGPVGVLMGAEGGLRGEAVERAVTLTLPAPKVAQRALYWRQALEDHEAENLQEISERFHMPGAYIRQTASMAIAHAALDQRDTVEMSDIREASRALNRQLLDTLAHRLETEGSWDRLIVSDATTAKLHELEQRCRHRERLLEHLGPGFGSGSNRGVRALFTGASGTGKTLAAKILAAELGMDLYRVDLAAVVNKYIGETEKNLHRVLSRAEELDVVLLLDEGDALLGNRTEVKSANDRYANLETNYLLQRLENYQGIVVVTTNAGENIDNAFQRRMDVVVNFIPPEAHERWYIWQLHLPLGHAVDDHFLEGVALRCAMTGGQIRNAALHATLLALDEGDGTFQRSHLEQAIQSEYRKAGATSPLNGNGRRSNHHASVAAFFDALSD